MTLAINKAFISGNLTRDPNVRFTSTEKAVADFSIACNRKFKSADGEIREEVTFVDVEAWGRTAELVGQYLTKGKAAFIEGRLKLDQWEDPQGNKRSRLKVIAEHVQFLSARSSDAERGHSEQDDNPRAEKNQEPKSNNQEDEPPF